MDRNEYADYTAQLSRQIWGHPFTLLQADVVLVAILVEHVRALPAMSNATKVAIRAIVALALTDPTGAKELARELRGR